MGLDSILQMARLSNWRNLEICRLTISNTIIFSEFLVAPGGVNGVAHGSINKGGLFFKSLTSKDRVSVKHTVDT